MMLNHVVMCLSHDIRTEHMALIALRHKKVSRDIAEEGPERFYEPGDLGV